MAESLTTTQKTLIDNFRKVTDFKDYKLAWEMGEDEFGGSSPYAYLIGPNNKKFGSQVGGGTDDQGNLYFTISVDGGQGTWIDGRQYFSYIEVKVPPPASGPSWTKPGYNFPSTPQPVETTFFNPEVGGGWTQEEFDARVRAERKAPDKAFRAFVTFLTAAAVPVLGPKLGAALGLSGQAAVIGGSAILGAGAAAVTGQDPLTGAIKGAIGSITTTTYATDVGKAIGITSDVAARTVGNAIINAGLSGVQAALTPGSDIGKSILAGTVTGAVMINASDVAKAVLGDKAIGEIEKLTNLTANDVGNIFSNSVVQSVIATINNQDAGQAFINTAISNGVSQSVANSMWKSFQDSFKGREDVLAGIVTAVQGVADTGVSAALYNQDVSRAIENAIPGILISSLRSYNLTADEMLRRQQEEQRVKQTASGSEVLVAGPPPADLLRLLNSNPAVGETVTYEGFDKELDHFYRRVEGFKNDGTKYAYGIHIFDNGTIYYTYFDPNQPNNVALVEQRPSLQNSPTGVGVDKQAPQVQRQPLPTTGLIDLRTFVSNLAPGGQVVFSRTPGVVGGTTEKGSTGFSFIGKDGSGRDRFKIGDINFTVISIDGKDVFVNDQFTVFLEPVVDPVTKKPELKPTRASEPFNPPQQEPAPTPEPTPVPTPTPAPQPTPIAPREEGQTGVGGATGVAGGAPSGPSQPAPAPIPSPISAPVPAPAPAPVPAPAPAPVVPAGPTPAQIAEQQRIEQARRAAEEERIKEEMARQQAEAAAAEQARLEQARRAAEETARVAKIEAERKAAEAEAKRIAEEQARIAEQERIAREEAERARKAAEKLEADVRSSKSAVEQVISTVTPSDFQIPEPVASLDQASYKFGTEDLGRFSEQQTAYQDTAKQIQNEIDNLVSVKDQVSLIFDSFDPAVKERLRPEFDARVKDLDSQINNLVSQKNQASNLAEQTIKEMQEAERFLEQIRQERTGKVETARGVRTEREQAQYEREQAQFEKDLKNLEAAIAKARSDEEKAQARQLFSTQQRERLRETGRLTGTLQAQIDAELGNLLDQYEDAQRRASSAATQKEGLVAPQQPGDAGRGISDQDVIDLLGLDRGTAERYGFFGDTEGVAGGFGPGAGLEGEAGGSGVEGDGPGSGEEGVGPGAGEEGFGPGGDVEDVVTRLRPTVIYKPMQERGTQGIPQRVTAESVAGILGDKEPLFGGDDDEQRAIWNRRSLRLRKALGL